MSEADFTSPANKSRTSNAAPLRRVRGEVSRRRAKPGGKSREHYHRFRSQDTPMPAFYFLKSLSEIPLGSCGEDFGWGQGGEAGASPKRAVTAEPTRAAAKSTAARRVFAEKAGCFVAPRSQPHCGMLPRRASPSSLFRENRTPRNFQTGSKKYDISRVTFLALSPRWTEVNRGRSQDLCARVRLRCFPRTYERRHPFSHMHAERRLERWRLLKQAPLAQRSLRSDDHFDSRNGEHKINNRAQD